jgi:hypothetical protein
MALIRLVVVAAILLPAGCLFREERRVVPAGSAPGDATAALQAQLDHGGRIFLPRLPDGRCYRTRGLWVTRSGTELRSNGACLEALGPGPVRLRSPDGDPVSASAVLFVSRAAGGRRPVLVRLRGLRIVVPRAAGTYGIAIFADGVAVRDVTVEGEPIDALLIGGRGAVPARNVTIAGARLLGGRRNVVSVVSAVGLRIENSVVSGASDEYGRPGSPSAGIDLEPDDRDDPIVDVRIAGNRIEGNAGPGILLALSTASGLPRRATAIVVEGNRIVGNDRKTSPPQPGGIAFQGGQADGGGWVRVHENRIGGSRAAGLQGHPTEGTSMRVLATRNDLNGNAGGPASFVRLGRGSRIATSG